ncbi:alpha/beta-hydrolase [Hyaloscypha variabilis]
MADFSKFGYPSREWQEHVAKYGPAPEAPIGKVPALAIQRSTNAGREEASAKQMKIEGLSSKVDIQTILIHARDNFLIPTRIYKRAGTSYSDLPIYVFYHGGGFVYGTLDSEDAACSRIVVALDIIVFHISYRHAPRHPFPEAHNDALDAFNWIMENGDAFGGDLGNVVVGGVSAGANLACHVVLARNAALARDYESDEGAIIKGLVLVTPWLVVNKEKISYDEFATEHNASRVQCSNAPVVSSKVLDFFVNCMGEEVHNNLDVDPDVGLVSGNKLRGLPSTTIMVAGSDPLRDEALLFARNLHENDVPVHVHVFPGLPHGFRRFDDLPSSRRWDELVVEGIKWSLSDDTMTYGSELSLNVV